LPPNHPSFHPPDTDPRSSPRSGALLESYHWWLNNIEYVLSKVHTIPADAYSQETAIPDLDSATPLAHFWILEVRAQVESKPELIQSGQDRLAQTQKRLLGVFEFKVFDRRAFDTRIMSRN
jgi:mediator of RNA polymerase II transcription subunit 18, fungi type